MVGDSRPFPHLSNILHQLGHELHLDLTQDIKRRDAARRFQKRIEAPLIHAKMENAAATTRPTFPLPPHQLKPECGDCAILTMKKPIDRKYQKPPPLPVVSVAGKERSSETRVSVTATTSKKSISVKSVSNQKWRKIQQRRRLRHKMQRPKMFDSATQTDNLPPVSVAASGEATKVDLLTVDQEVVVKKEEKLPSPKPQRRVTPVETAIAKTPSPQPKNKSSSIAQPEQQQAPQSHLSTKLTRKCGIPVAETAIAKVPKEQQLYAPVELHCVTDAAVKAVDRTIAALQKLVLLSPKNSIDKSLLKTISLMCVFLRQFHTELRTRKDRRSKLEAILRIWSEISKEESSLATTQLPASTESAPQNQKQSTVSKAVNGKKESQKPPSKLSEEPTIKIGASPVSPDQSATTVTFTQASQSSTPSTTTATKEGGKRTTNTRK